MMLLVGMELADSICLCVFVMLLVGVSEKQLHQKISSIFGGMLSFYKSCIFIEKW